jgi:serine/threonine-protein kinase
MPLSRITARWFAAAALGGAPLLFASPEARAGDPAAAQALYDEARQLLSQGRTGDACPKFEESQRLDPGLGTQFHLADCYQRLGRKATAWSMFRDVEAQASARGQAARARVARERAEALAPWVTKLAIMPHEAAAIPGFTLVRDGVEVDRAQWGAPVPVDPGMHMVAAQAPGKQPWIFQVDVGPEQTIVNVDVPALADAAPTAAIARNPPPRPAPVRTVGVAQPLPAPARNVGVAQARPAPARAVGVAESMPPDLPPPAYANDHVGDGQRAFGWTVAGLGLASFAVGTFYAYAWLDDMNRANSRCNPTCNAQGARLRGDQRTNGEVAFALAGGGGAAMIVGAALVASAPRALVRVAGRRRRRRHRAGGAEPRVGPDRTGGGSGRRRVARRRQLLTLARRSRSSIPRKSALSSRSDAATALAHQERTIDVLLRTARRRRPYDLGRRP